MLLFRCAEPFVQCCGSLTDRQERASIAVSVLTGSLRVSSTVSQSDGEVRKSRTLDFIHVVCNLLNDQT